LNQISYKRPVCAESRSSRCVFQRLLWRKQTLRFEFSEFEKCPEESFIIANQGAKRLVSNVVVVIREPVVGRRTKPEYLL
jgi:hypothetical protein